MRSTACIEDVPTGRTLLFLAPAAPLLPSTCIVDAAAPTSGDDPDGIRMHDDWGTGPSIHESSRRWLYME